MVDKAFVYGKSVGGPNFTDRKKETARLIQDFTNGLNVILVSPRRMGKTSLVKNVQSQLKDEKLKIIFLDVYDCRDEYDFYNRLAESLFQATSHKIEQVLENVKDFLVRISPKVSFSPSPDTDFSISLGISPQNYKPEEILQLPEKIAAKNGYQIVVCIDEFQQIGEFPDSLLVQKRLRGVWQHQQNVSYCLFGSKKHLMSNLFQNKHMPFYQFGELMYLAPISTENWIPFLCQRFADKGKTLSSSLARKICESVKNHSSYVQQFAWNILAEVQGDSVTEEDFANGLSALLAQNEPLFIQQTQGLSSYQLNFLRAVCNDIHTDFGRKEVTDKFPLGTKSNIPRLKTALLERELIDLRKDGIHIADAVFEIWFKQEMMRNYTF